MNILCAACGEPAPNDSDPCPHCGGVVRLHDRYVLEAQVGQGAAGVTYRALDLTTGERVAVKEMALRTTDPELPRRMAREARVQGELHHDRIPAYVEHFTQGVGKKQVFYLIQAFIEGPTLAEEMQRRRYSEPEVLAILGELCEVLTYLHQLMPPVVHRDLKLKNVIRRARDQKLVLIDFGAVRDVVTDPRTGGSTVAGTYGYMAPEQYRGEASPQTDLYALGVLGVVLLSRRDPLELVRPDHSLDWQGHVHASAPTVALIEALLQPDPARRPASATEVARRLAGGSVATPPKPTPPSELPARVLPGALLGMMRPRRRSRWAAMGLAVVGAPFGVHWWYLDRPILGVLSAAFCWSGIPLLVSLIFAVRTFSAGRLAFDLRYNPTLMDPSTRADQVAREIEALYALHTKGALTAEEFEREKLRVLNDMGASPLPIGGLFDLIRTLQGLPRMLQDELRNPNKRRRP